MGHALAHQLQMGFSTGTDKSGGDMSVTARVLSGWLDREVFVIPVLMELGYWAAWPSMPDSNMPELCNLNFDVQLVVFLLSIDIFLIKNVNVSPLRFQTDTILCIFISKARD